MPDPIDRQLLKDALGDSFELTRFVLTAESRDQEELVRAWLLSQAARERARQVRDDLLVLLATTSGVVWLVAIAPEHWGGPLRRIFLIAWGLQFLATLFALSLEKLLARRARQARAALGSDEPR